MKSHSGCVIKQPLQKLAVYHLTPCIIAVLNMAQVTWLPRRWRAAWFKSAAGAGVRPLSAWICSVGHGIDFHTLSSRGLNASRVATRVGTCWQWGRSDVLVGCGRTPSSVEGGHGAARARGLKRHGAARAAHGGTGRVREGARRAGHCPPRRRIDRCARKPPPSLMNGPRCRAHVLPPPRAASRSCWRWPPRGLRSALDASIFPNLFFVYISISILSLVVTVFLYTY